VVTNSRSPHTVTVDPIGPVTQAPVPIAVVAMYRSAPPFGDGGPRPAEAVALAWTVAQVQVHPIPADAGTAVWLPARDVHRIRDLARPLPVVARVRARGGEPADVPGLALAHATDRAGEAVAVRVRLAPDTDQAHERWLLATDLVDRDPLDDVAG
jgi:hypothetical protein